MLDYKPPGIYLSLDGGKSGVTQDLWLSAWSGIFDCSDYQDFLAFQPFPLVFSCIQILGSLTVSIAMQTNENKYPTVSKRVYCLWKTSALSTEEQESTL